MWKRLYGMKVGVKLLGGFFLLVALGFAMGYWSGKSGEGLLGAAEVLAGGLVLAVLLGWGVTRTITTPLRRIQALAGALATGNLDVELGLGANGHDRRGGGEVVQLAAAIEEIAGSMRQQAAEASRIAKGDMTVQVTVKSEKDELALGLKQILDTIRELLAEMNRMSDEHDAGDIDVFLRTDKFEGAYRVVAQGVNDMVKGHIAVKKKAMAAVAEFARGNFEAPLEKFPGKKAFINDNVEQLRSNLKEINLEINKLIRASQEGRLQERGDVHRFTGDWASLIGGLNGLVDAILEPIQEAAGVLEEMASGSLQMTVKGDYKGDHAKIKHALNNTIGTLSTYVQEITEVMGEMARGNMDVELRSSYQGDFAPIKSSLSHVLQSFNELLNDINNAAHQVAAGAMQVSSSAQLLSQGATEQASSVQQLTASLEQIGAQTKQNAQSAVEASGLAGKAKMNAVQGNEQMQQMLKAMDDINESSGNISKIIKVIDEIAFQTNILALNAAVEAARAGQHGKGFAVVAEEVRNLAARSANAAKETAALIEGSIRKVEGGTRIANETAGALNKIVEDVAKAADLVGEIATASSEQATGIVQINQGIGIISDVTQTNSATSEESAAASEELSGQAEMLKEMVGRFRLKHTGGAPTGGGSVISGMHGMSGMSGMSGAPGGLGRPGAAEPSGRAESKYPGSSGSGSAGPSGTLGNKKRISLGERDFGKY
ncbi:methyl-accepting chemotaxis protein [Paenibacillus koleovorans]|uniref:methyl-accepting chemotaxis protein n=1 Tax=Paenibacillus koleovorans TaxID=121608 RepID=UPI001580EA17|nr:methyl-accepting chemotaxis protein [Paenibacillus koleovorans]